MNLMIGLHEAVLQNVGWHTAKTVEMCSMKAKPRFGSWKFVGWRRPEVFSEEETVGDQHDKDLYKFLYYKDEKGIQEHDLGSSWVCVI